MLQLVLSPLLLERILEFIEGGAHAGVTSVSAAYAFALALFVCGAAVSLVMGQYFLRGFRLGLRIQVAMSHCVFIKALSLSYEERHRFGIGSIVSYMQIDAAKINEAVPYLHSIWSAPMP